MKKEKIFLQHPKFGTFEGYGKTVAVASKNCLIKIAKYLKGQKLPKSEIKMYLDQASTLIKLKVTKGTR